MGAYLKARAQEASTWRGIVMLLTAAGVQISPEMAQAIVTIGLALAGTLGAVLPG